MREDLKKIMNEENIKNVCQFLIIMALAQKQTDHEWLGEINLHWKLEKESVDQWDVLIKENSEWKKWGEWMNQEKKVGRWFEITWGFVCDDIIRSIPDGLNHYKNEQHLILKNPAQEISQMMKDVPARLMPMIDQLNKNLSQWQLNQEESLEIKNHQKQKTKMKIR